MLGNSNINSMLFMEMASNGYCIISINHGDGSADFHPHRGNFPTDYKMYDYQPRRSWLKLRKEELDLCIKEIYKEKRLF
jgi:hypothetical protein